MPKTVLDKVCEIIRELADPEGARVAIVKRMAVVSRRQSQSTEKGIGDGHPEGRIGPGSASRLCCWPRWSPQSPKW